MLAFALGVLIGGGVAIAAAVTLAVIFVAVWMANGSH